MRNLLLSVMLMALAAGCDKEAEKQALDLAKKQMDQANQQVQVAQQEVKHVHRLRDIDRTRLDAEKNKAEGEALVWRGLLVCLILGFLVLLIWLARELRLRRIVSHILIAQRNRKGVKIE